MTRWRTPRPVKGPIRRRDETGAAGLIELMVATALAMILLAMIAQIGVLTEKSVRVDRTLYSAQGSALHTLEVAVNHLADAAPLGACASPTGSVALSQCQTVTQVGPVLDAAVLPSGNNPNGMCYYAYQSSTTGLVPPILACAVDYPANGQVYVIDYTPGQAYTYTNCAANTCFGGEAPSPGVLPPEPTAGNCTASAGCSAVLAATVEGTQAGFGFTTPTGPWASGDALADIDSASVNVTVAAGSYGQTATYNYHFTASVPAAAYREAQSWQAGQEGAS